MIPIGTFVDVRETFGPQTISRFNLYPTAQINGSPAPGYSSGQSLELMEQLARSKNANFEWTGMSFQEKRLTRISIFIVWLFIACHVWKLIPTVYEMLMSENGTDHEDWPWAVVCIEEFSHLAVTVNSAVNFLIYLFL